MQGAALLINSPPSPIAMGERGQGDEGTMTRKQKIVVFIISLIFTLLLALAGAVPYGYFMLALGGLSGGTYPDTLLGAV